MIKNSSFENEYFIVLKPEGDVLNLAEYLQDKLSNKYDLYPDDVYPEIHITLDRIYNNRIDEAIEIIKSVILKYTEIDIVVQNFDCYSFKENNFLVLNVEENKKLVEFSSELHEKLAQKGISTIENYHEWKFHISLASTVFAESKQNFDDEFQDLCFRFEGVHTPRSCKAKQIEIWRPTLDESIKCIKKFQL
jgi:2'-5' RNA ligase